MVVFGRGKKPNTERQEDVVYSLSDVREELERSLKKDRFWQAFRSTVSALILVAAVSVLVATLWMPVLEVYGTSMTPTLSPGDLLLSWKSKEIKRGDLIAFYFNNKVLIKRVIAKSGDWVDIHEDGSVLVNGEAIKEEYLTEKALGETDLTYPFQVPEARYFVMGDHRATSVDSRVEAMGCVADEQLVGKILFRFWPLQHDVEEKKPEEESRNVAFGLFMRSFAAE